MLTVILTVVGVILGIIVGIVLCFLGIVHYFASGEFNRDLTGETAARKYFKKQEKSWWKFW